PSLLAGGGPDGARPRHGVPVPRPRDVRPRLRRARARPGRRHRPGRRTGGRHLPLPVPSRRGRRRPDRRLRAGRARRRAGGGAAVGNFAVRIAAGIAADRFGVDRVLLAILGADLLAAALLQAPGGSAAVVVAAIAAGIGFGGPAGVLSRLAAGGAPDAPHSASGLLFAGFTAGAFSGPLLGAAAGGGSRSWLILGGLAAAGLVVLGVRALHARRNSH